MVFEISSHKCLKASVGGVAGPVGIYLSMSVVNAAWTSVNMTYRNSKHWKQSAPMKEQFYCHFYMLALKRVVYKSWFIDIEPARPAVGTPAEDVVLLHQHLPDRRSADFQGDEDAMHAGLGSRGKGHDAG